MFRNSASLPLTREAGQVMAIGLQVVNVWDEWVEWPGLSGAKPWTCLSSGASEYLSPGHTYRLPLT